MISELKVGDKIHIALVVRIQKFGTSSNGKPFARGFLDDASGQIPFITFDVDVVDKLHTVEQPVPYVIHGSVENNKFSTDAKPQIVIQKVCDLLPEDDISHLLPKGDFDRDVYQNQLQKFIAMVRSPVLHVLLENIFQGELMEKFLSNPAGMKMHHAYLGGLFQHSVDVTKLALAMGEQIGNVDKDLLIAGSLLHDIGKLREISAGYGFPYTDEGRLLGHITMSALMVQSQAEKLKMSIKTLEPLMHILLSHHGENDKGSPVACVTKEAFIVHYADEVDSVMNQFKDSGSDGWTYNKMLQRNILG